MPYLDLPTHRLHYRVEADVADNSDKPWLIFCNSLGTDLHMWDGQIAYFGQDFRVLRYDRRGHGLSSAPTPPYELADLGNDVIALMDALSIERANFCGLSIGGLTGQWLGVHAGQRLSKLVVCATAARIGTEDGWKSRIDSVRQSGLGPMRSGTAERWFSPAFVADNPDKVNAILDKFETTSQDGYVGCCAALAGADLTADLSRLTVPVLAVSGNDDPVCPPVDLADIASAVRNGRHISLAGRHIINIESAASFNKIVGDFLLSQSTPT
jgi:3-oxoadipate enol-lactonase